MTARASTAWPQFVQEIEQMWKHGLQIQLLEIATLLYQAQSQ